jgi:transposase
VPELARELGVSPQTLTNWIAQDRIDAGELPGLTSDERARLAELEREVRILREEREILRKAAGFFAQETMRPGGSR